MAFEVTDAGFHLGQKVAVITDGERSSHPWFIRMAYVHRLGGNQFIRLYEVARLRSKEDDRIIPTDTVDAVYLNQEIGRTYIQIDQVPDKRLVPWVETPKTDSWEAPEGSHLTREEMKQSFVDASVAASNPYEEVEKMDKVDKPLNPREAVAATLDEHLARLNKAVEDYQIKKAMEVREKPEPDEPTNPRKAVVARFAKHLAKSKQAEADYQFKKAVEDYQSKQAVEEREESEPETPFNMYPHSEPSLQPKFRIGDVVLSKSEWEAGERKDLLFRVIGVRATHKGQASHYGGDGPLTFVYELGRDKLVDPPYGLPPDVLTLARRDRLYQWTTATESDLLSMYAAAHTLGEEAKKYLDWLESTLPVPATT